MRFLEDHTEILMWGKSGISPGEFLLDRPSLAEKAQQLPQDANKLIFHGKWRLETLEQAQRRSQDSVQVEDAQHLSSKLRSSQTQALIFQVS